MVQGGFGSAFLEFMAQEGVTGVKVRCLGISDRFIPHGTQAELAKLCGFDQDAIAKTALQMVRLAKKEKKDKKGSQG